MISPNTSTTRRDSPTGTWFKSTFSHPNGNECVEVRFDTDLVHIRDSKDHGLGPVLRVPATHWTAVLDEITGRTPVGSNTALHIAIDTDGGAHLHTHNDPDTVLSYTPDEWSAFTAGVHNAEFNLPQSEPLTV